MAIEKRYGMPRLSKKTRKNSKRLRLTYRKGYIYTIEVMLAVAVIMFMIVLSFSSVPEQPETNLVIIKQGGYNALQYLDQSGVLRELAIRNDSYVQLKNNVTPLISANVAFDVAICNTCNSSLLPTNRTIVTADYYIGGYKNYYIGKKVRLWMWELF